MLSAIIQFYNLRSGPGRRVIVATHCAGAGECEGRGAVVVATFLERHDLETKAEMKGTGFI